MTAAPVDYRHTPCPDCHGDGTTLDAGLPAWCPTCNGTVYDPDGTLTGTCLTCYGDGQDPCAPCDNPARCPVNDDPWHTHPCPDCGGDSDDQVEPLQGEPPLQGRRTRAWFSDWPEATLALAAAIVVTLAVFGRRDYDSVPALLVCLAVYVPTYLAAAAVRKRVAR